MTRQEPRNQSPSGADAASADADRVTPGTYQVLRALYESPRTLEELQALIPIPEKELAEILNSLTQDRMIVRGHRAGADMGVYGVTKQGKSLALTLYLASGAERSPTAPRRETDPHQMERELAPERVDLQGSTRVCTMCGVRGPATEDYCWVCGTFYPGRLPGGRPTARAPVRAASRWSPEEEEALRAATLAAVTEIFHDYGFDLPTVGQTPRIVLERTLGEEPDPPRLSGIRPEEINPNVQRIDPRLFRPMELRVTTGGEARDDETDPVLASRAAAEADASPNARSRSGKRAQGSSYGVQQEPRDTDSSD